ncbi:Spore cortex-lytic enzyme [Ascidiaceihabitans donghaensis]|uniref:Spore cortex-lytic enzyme n=1 Tax=Ascidiaceihabitans donghaensis TaxID=1510460 RepID=A0A2R8BC31_9RHOB|nr:peptidoglycan-binding domain-containing protein [Ascidiaceihabitans donghaensis]SPH20623.1 Spore cortex-lytic enzyme [Ascidiaceihabitans donghaensis]
MRWCLAIALTLMGVISTSIFGSVNLIKPAVAQNLAVMPGNREPMTRPAPQARPRPNVARPMPVRPRPSMTRPSYNKPSVRPQPFPTRPSRPGVGSTRPLFDPNTGQGVRPTIVRPRPTRPARPNPYPHYPDFVDTPQGIDDVSPNRPPIWRPPSNNPPYFRPPHPFWGTWYYYGGIGYYHRIVFRGRTIVIVEGLPAGCRTRVRRGGQSYYKCNGIYYKALHLRGDMVYEVSGRDGASTASNETMRLTKPFMRGPRVLQLQRSLKRRGYNVGTPDGIFGRGTARALKAFQGDVGLTPDGVAGRATLRALR